MKNLNQIAEDSSYSFGMISGQKGERFLAYARNDNNVILTTVGRKNLLPKRISFWKAMPFRISRQARVQSPPLRIGRWRFLTLDHRSRFGMTIMSFWMQRKRNEESQTNSRGFLTYVRNDIYLSFWGVEHRRISPQAYVMLSDSEASPAKREYNRHRFE